MKINVVKTGKFLSSLIFISLFPLFFLYHFALATDIIEPFLGGWYGITSIISLIIIFPFGVLSFLKEKQLPLQIGIMFSILVLYVGVWAGIHYFLGTNWRASYATFEGSGGLIIFWVVLFLVGYFMNEDRWFKWTLLGSLLMISYFTLSNIDLNTMMFIGQVQFSATEGIASYQGFARSTVVVAIALLALNQNKLGQALIATLGAVTLFFVGARAEFFGFLAVCAIWSGIIFLRGKPIHKILISSIVVVCILLAIVTIDDVGSSRQLQVFNLASASSWQKRVDLLKEGWNSIYSSPFIGDYAGQMETRGFGSYIHNGLSVWRQYGILGFVLYFGISIISFLVAFRAVILKGRLTKRWLLAFYMNCSTLILLVVAKSVFWGFPALAWGLATGALKKDRQTFEQA